MSSPRQRRSFGALKRCHLLPLSRCLVPVFFLGAFNTYAQILPDNIITARSVSQQFVVTSIPQFSPLFNRREVLDNTNLVRLDPNVLVVSAERFKASFRDELGLDANASWTGKIFLTLHPARSFDDGVTITISPIMGQRDYRVELPDVVRRARYARSLTAALLLELANRTVPAETHSAEIPAWLADGLAQSVIHDDFGQNVLSAPQNVANSLPQLSLNRQQRGLHLLAAARGVLQNNFTLTFDQLSWPDDAQVNGDDGGVYLASTQLFVHELLDLKDGPQKLRAFIAQLSNYLNWQTAFFATYHEEFPRPLDVEKWWALRVASFASHNYNSQWTLAESRAQLADLLAVPVNLRRTADSLPVHAEISWQSAIRSFSPAECDTVLAAKLSDLEFEQFRFAPPFAGLIADYRATLADFLGRQKKVPPTNHTGNRTLTPVMTQRGTPARKSPVGYDQSVAQYNAAMTHYFEELKKNPQLGIVSRTPVNGTNRPAATVASPGKMTTTFANPADLAVAPKKASPAPIAGRQKSAVPARSGNIKGTLKKLDALDLRRRDLEARLNLDSTLPNVVSAAP
jgi:hypothetical protein